MPSIAIQDGCPLYAADMTHDDVPKYYGVKLGCIVCKVALKMSHTGYPYYTVYFAHSSKRNTCLTSNISREHLALQALVFNYIQQQGWEAYLEYAEYAGKWRGDVVAKKRSLNRMVIFEIQKSSISERLVIERTNKHKASKVYTTIWICLSDFSWMDKVASCLVDVNDWNEREELQASFKVLPRVEDHSGEPFTLFTRQLHQLIKAVLDDTIVPKYESEVAKFINNEWQVWRYAGYLFQSRECAEQKRNNKFIKSIRNINKRNISKSIKYANSQIMVARRFKDASLVMSLCGQYLPGINFKPGTENTAFGEVADYKGKTIVVSPQCDNFVRFSASIVDNDNAVIIYRHEEQRADAVDKGLDWRKAYSIHELTSNGRLAMILRT